MQIACSQQIINYRHIPGGPQPLVILHGWGRSLNEWLFLGDHADLLETHSLYILDLPGFGNSSTPTQLLTVYDYADLVEEFCDRFKLVSPDILGHSFGGRLGIILAAQKHLAINKLILVDTGGIEKKSFAVLAKIWAYKIFIKPFRRLLGPFGSSDYQSLSSDIMRRVFISTVNTDLSHLATQISDPTLIVWGKKDTTVPLWHAKFWRDHISDARLRIAWSSGHSPHTDEPEELAGLVSEFLART